MALNINKRVKVEDLTDLEESMQWYLQEVYDTTNRSAYKDMTEYNDIVLFANFLANQSEEKYVGKAWAILKGEVVLMKYKEV